MRTTLGPGTLYMAMLDISEPLGWLSADFRLLAGTMSVAVPITEATAETWTRIMDEDWRARWYVAPEAAWWERDRG